MAKLTAKQRAFVEEYLIDLNATQAAIRAGYSQKTAKSVGQENLTKPDVRAAVEKANKERLQRNQVDADYILRRLSEIDEMDVADLLDEAGNIRSVSDWPKVWRTTISGIDLHELLTGDTKTIVRKIKWPDKVRNLELLGKHIRVGAFEEKVRHKIEPPTIIINRPNGD